MAFPTPHEDGDAIREALASLRDEADRAACMGLKRMPDSLRGIADQLEAALTAAVAERDEARKGERFADGWADISRGLQEKAEAALTAALADNARLREALEKVAAATPEGRDGRRRIWDINLAFDGVREIARAALHQQEHPHG